MKIKHRCDDHPLVLNFDDNDQHGTNWCVPFVKQKLIQKIGFMNLKCVGSF